MYSKTSVWPELAPFIDALSRRLGLPSSTTVFPAGDEAFLRAATSFVEAAREVYDIPLRLESLKILPNWPRGNDESEGTRSLDAFVAAHLTVPDVAQWFDGATLREPETDEDAERFESVVNELRIADAPILVYALGAAFAVALSHHVAARWVGGPNVNVEEEGPPGMQFGAASVLFPFEAAKSKLADPRATLWAKRFSALEAPPPRGMAATMDEARDGWAKLLPDGALALLDGWEERGLEVALPELEALVDAHSDNALLIRLVMPIAAQLPDLGRAAALGRRLLEAYPHVNAKFCLADVLSCMPEEALMDEGEKLFREVLGEQPMMTRARLKLGLLLAEQGRRDEAVSELREVASAWGDDAEEAREYLAELGETEEVPLAFATEARGPVILGAVADLGRWLSPSVVRDHGMLAVYLIAKRSELGNQLLSRIPERPIDDAVVSAIFGAVEALVRENQVKLTSMLGDATFSAGFHATASLADVRPSFEEDGFVLGPMLVDGEIVPSA